jgi:hypothetical protein
MLTLKSSKCVVADVQAPSASSMYSSARLGSDDVAPITGVYVASPTGNNVYDDLEPLANDSYHPLPVGNADYHDIAPTLSPAYSDLPASRYEQGNLNSYR